MRRFLILFTLLIAGSACAVLPRTAAAAAAVHRPIVSASFGRTADAQVRVFTLTNVHGIEARIMTYGATLVSLRTPDRKGHFENIILGFATLDPYLAGVPYFGATIGRFANRIAKGRFTVDGESYRLALNNGPNSLHGGRRGFDKRVWQAQPFESPTGPAVRLRYSSPAGEEGYPGKLTVRVTYRLNDDDSLAIEFEATTTAATPVNLANHAYFNLTGDPTRSIIDHVLKINASRFTPVDATLIPTGELRSVAGTAFDFRTPRIVGSRIEDNDEQLRLAGGYDHNWVLDKLGSEPLTLAAVLTDPGSGRSLEVRTTQPGLQFYSGNFLGGGTAVGAGAAFGRRNGLCLETQHFPDSPNQPGFPTTILRPGQIYSEKTVLAFRVAD